eukprot:1975458-Ditylum_brightwellii.AAC.1
MVLMIVLTIMMTVPISTLYLSHKQLIVVWQREVSKTSVLLAIKMMVLTIVLTIVTMVPISTSHLSQAVDCHLTEKSKQNECVVGNKDDSVDNSVENSDARTNKQLTHPSQAVDCHSMER